MNWRSPSSYNSELLFILEKIKNDKRLGPMPSTPERISMIEKLKRWLYLRRVRQWKACKRRSMK